MIGCDIIDLKDQPKRTTQKLRRYRQRVLTPLEQEWVEASDFRLWNCWALKESAYKLDYSRKPGNAFRPKMIECRDFQPFPPANGFSARVQGETGIFFGRTFQTSETIFAIVAAEERVLSNTVSKMVATENARPEEQSQQIRSALTDYLIHTGRVGAATEVEVLRKPYPVLYMHGRISGSVSFTHHGSWAAFSLYLP